MGRLLHSVESLLESDSAGTLRGGNTQHAGIPHTVPCPASVAVGFIWDSAPKSSTVDTRQERNMQHSLYSISPAVERLCWERTSGRLSYHAAAMADCVGYLRGK